jgi:hypothetical protein
MIIKAKCNVAMRGVRNNVNRAFPDNLVYITYLIRHYFGTG